MNKYIFNSNSCCIESGHDVKNKQFNRIFNLQGEHLIGLKINSLGADALRWFCLRLVGWLVFSTSL